MQSWTLSWWLFEVIRDDLRLEASEQLTTVVGPARPTGPSFDVRDFVRLRVNERGYAEWMVKTGSDVRTGIVETEAERVAARERERRRSEALKLVDWTVVRDLKRTPALAYSDSDGCGNLFVYGWSADRTEAITVGVDKELLQLSTTPRTLDVAAIRLGLDVAVHVYERAMRGWPFCTHMRVSPGEPEERWTLTAGAVTIALSPAGVLPRSPHLYRATIEIFGGEFVSSSGIRVRQSQPITLSADAGGMVY